MPQPKLAVWNLPPADFFLSGASSGAAELPYEVERTDPRSCEERLRTGEADVALLPTTRILRHPGDYDVLSAVALSSWTYPYARLVLKNGLRGSTRTVATHPDDAQEAFLARIFLKEHYDLTLDFVSHEGSLRERLDAGEDAALLVGKDVPTLQIEKGLALDVGQEWYEMAQYPMVWGLFATRKDEADPDMIRTLRGVAEAAEEHRGMWLQSREMPEPLHNFYAESMRLRLGRLATASLTELREHFFYYEVTDEVPDVPFIYLPDDEQDSEDGGGYGLDDGDDDRPGLRRQLFG